MWVEDAETMSGVQRFEDLVAWQKARVLTRAIYESTRQAEFAKDFGLTGQIQRAAASIMSNIAEGYERRSPRDFQKFLIIAKASCAELRFQLFVALDVGYINQQQCDALMAQTIEVSRILSGLHQSIDKDHGSS